MNDDDGNSLSPVPVPPEERGELFADLELTAGTGAYVWEPGRRLLWSDGLFRLLGIDPDAKGGPVRDSEFFDRVHPDDRAYVREHWARALNGDLRPTRYRIVRPDGKLRYLRGQGSVTRQRDGAPERIVGTIVDVTDLHETIEELARAHALAKMEAVGTLAAGVAHDFNNFLTVIVCQLDELRGVVSATQQAPLDDARHAAEQCALLTEKLLAFARKQPPAFSRIDLGATLRRVETLLRRVCPPAVTLTIDVQHGPIYVRSETNQLESLLMNLALNARDAMPNGGTLGFTVDQVSVEPGQASSRPGEKPGRYARIQVKDTGVGIRPEHLPRIFEPYFSTKAVGQGTGLGLASVYSSVRLHGGEIHVDSQPGQGTTFYVFLPADSEDERSGTAPKAAGPGSLLANRHVLVVEDVDVVRRTVVAGLQRAGARVTAVTDGCHALEFLASGVPIDIVLTDLIMPRMGGLELARELDKKFPDLPIVFMSGYADHEVVEAIVRDHPNQPLLRKPFSVKELTDAISGALARSKTRA